MPLQPIFLLADSQLLFWSDEKNLMHRMMKESMVRPTSKAAYLGASNGDDPQFYSIFEAAMEGLGVRDCRHIRSSFARTDEDYLRQSDIILLGGGDVERGWKVFNETGMKDLIINRYDEGTLLLGCSAGAIQLGLFGLIRTTDSITRLIETFKLVPFVISAHEEKEERQSLKETIEQLGESVKGIGIATGGGLIYHPDHRIEAIRRPLYEFSMRGGQLQSTLLTAE